jgi:hypothetical protein
MWRVLLSLTAVLAACESALINPIGDLDECPTLQSEFPPTDCAIVRGSVRSPSGVPRVGFPVRVDSMVPQVGYHYASNTAVTDPDGLFEITVYRITRLQPVTNPDTARIEIKTYATAGPRPGDPPTGRVRVLMYFAPLGETVRVTLTDLIF